MKTIQLIAITMILTIGSISCSSDNDDAQQFETDPMAGFNLLAETNANGHTLELYSEDDGLITGYNEIYIRVKDNIGDSYFTDVEISWMPMMHMMGMTHSCPRSAVALTEDNTVSKGFILFQMAGTESEYWELTINYRVGEQDYSLAQRIVVKPPSDQKQRITAFLGNDELRYVLALVNPMKPKVGVNEMQVLLYKMENETDFPLVKNYKLSLDPRMPGMGNHSSPNNTDLNYNAHSGTYDGKLNLSMTGYWMLNLKLLDEVGTVIKGEDVNADREASSLFFELEF